MSGQFFTHYYYTHSECLQHSVSLLKKYSKIILPMFDPENVNVCVI